MSTTETYTKSGSAPKTREVKAHGPAQQERPMKAEPQKEHEWLQKLVGEWSFEGEMFMEPGKTPGKFTGTESVRSIGDLWILMDIQSEIHGNPQSMVVTLGYDSQSKRFVGTFFSSMMTHLWLYDGSLDSAERVLTLNTEGPSMTGEEKSQRSREVIEVKSDDERILTAQVLGDDGKWHKTMTIHYQRTK